MNATNATKSPAEIVAEARAAHRQLSVSHDVLVGEHHYVAACECGFNERVWSARDADRAFDHHLDSITESARLRAYEAAAGEIVAECPVCGECATLAGIDVHMLDHATEPTTFEQVMGIRTHSCGDDRLRFATINGVGTEYVVIEAENGDGDCDVMCLAAPNCSVMPMLRNVPFVTALQYATFLVATEMMANDAPSTRTGTGSAYDAIAQATAATLA